MQAETLTESLTLTDEENPLPEDWQQAKLSELCSFIRGVSFDKAAVSNKPKDNFLPILRAGNIQSSLELKDDLIWLPSEFVSSEQKLKVKDIAVCMSSGSPSVVGKTAQLKEDFEGSVGAFCGIIRPNNLEQADYIAHWFKSPSYEAWRDSQSRGANIQNLRFSEFETILIPLPPTIEEQRRIASILDEQMKAVEQARLAVEKQLAAANLLPNAFLRSVFESDKAKQWKLEKVGNISSLIIDGPHITPFYVPTGVPFLTVRNIVKRRIDFSETSFVTDADHQEFKKRGRAERGDILYSKDGTLGIPCVVDTDREFSFFVSVALIKLNRDIADPYFIAFALESPSVLEQVKLLGAGAGLKHMVLKSIRSLEIPLPSKIKEQKEVVEKLQEQMQTVETLKKSLTEKLVAIKNLAAALRRKAFAGEL